MILKFNHFRFKCQACFITDWSQDSSRAAAVPVHADAGYGVPQTFWKKATGPSLTTPSPPERPSQNHLWSVPSPPLHPPIPHRQDSPPLSFARMCCSAGREECELCPPGEPRGGGHRPHTLFTDPKGAGAASGSRRDPESASLNPFPENYAAVFKEKCSWCFCCDMKNSLNFFAFLAE